MVDLLTCEVALGDQYFFLPRLRRDGDATTNMNCPKTLFLVNCSQCSCSYVGTLMIL